MCTQNRTNRQTGHNDDQMLHMQCTEVAVNATDTNRQTHRAQAERTRCQCLCGILFKDRHTYRQASIQTDIDAQIDTHTVTTHKQTHPDMYKRTDVQTDRQTCRQTDRRADRQTDRQCFSPDP